MPAPTKSDHLFGAIALKNRLLSKEQLADCLEALEKAAKGRGAAKSLAEVVEKKKLLSPRAVASIARAQNYREVRLESKLYGRIAVKNKFAEVIEVRHCLEAQKKAYLNAEAPPDFGELMRARGHVTAEEDRAIREAMRKLDKEEYVGKAEALGGDEDDEVEVEAAEEEAETAEAEAPARKRGAKGAAARGGKAAAKPEKEAPGKKGARAAPPAKKRAADESDALELDDDDDAQFIEGEAGEEDDAETAEAGAIGDESEAPLGADTQGIELDAFLDEAAEAVGKLDAAPSAERSSNDSSSSEVGESSSSVSDSSSGRSSVSEPADTLAEDLASVPEQTEDGQSARKSDTGDVMDVVFAPDDLRPLKAGAGASGPEGDAAEKPGAGGGAKEPAAAGGVIAAVRDVTPSGGVARLEVDRIRSSAHECPRCNVTLEAGMTECLYCGYRVPQDGDEGNGSGGRAAKSPAPTMSLSSSDAEVKPAAPTKAPAAKAEAAKAASGKQPKAGGGVDALAAEFDALESLATCSRGELLRGKEKKSGEAKLVWRLPAGVVPEAAQLKAFKDDAAAVAKLSLKHVLDLERVIASDAVVAAVYDDAPGKPATERAKAAVLDRMRASRVVREVAAALGETTKAGVFAREVRPEAILLSDDDQPSPRIAAFGAARLCEPPAKNAPEAGDAFVPPERAKKADRADVRTDLFGVGALLKLLLTGSGPTGKEPKELPDVPGGLKTVLTKTLDPVTGKRFLDFQRLNEELEKAPGLKGTKVETKR